MIKSCKKLFYFTLSLFLLMSLSSCSYDKTVITLGSEFDSTWDFNDVSNYNFDENLVEIKNGLSLIHI